MSLVVLHEGAKRLDEAQREAGCLPPDPRVNTCELTKVVVAHKRFSNELGHLDRLHHEAVVTEDLAEPIGVKRWELVVVANEQATTRKHERTNHLGARCLRRLLHDDPVELFPRLDQPLDVAGVRRRDDNIGRVSDEIPHRTQTRLLFLGGCRGAGAGQLRKGLNPCAERHGKF